jgi:hypothetical protein
MNNVQSFMIDQSSGSTSIRESLARASAAVAVPASGSSIGSICVTAAATLALTTLVQINAAQAINIVTDTSKPLEIRAVASHSTAQRDWPVTAAIEKIRSFALLEDGWKGDGSVRPTNIAVQDAEAFARQLFSQSEIAAPHVGAAADGEINFYWKTPKVTADLSIVGDGTYHFFARTSDGTPIRGDELSVNSALPAELIQALT